MGVLKCRVALFSFSHLWITARTGAYSPVIPIVGSPFQLTFDAFYRDKSTEPVIMEDVRLDPRCANHPGVTGRPHMRFLFSAPLYVSDHLIGIYYMWQPNSVKQKPPSETIEKLKLLSKEAVTSLQRNLLQALGVDDSDDDTNNDQESNKNKKIEFPKILVDVASPKWKISSANDAWEQVTGVSMKDAVASAGLLDIMSPRHEPALLQAVAAAHKDLSSSVPVIMSPNDPGGATLQYCFALRKKAGTDIRIGEEQGEDIWEAEILARIQAVNSPRDFASSASQQAAYINNIVADVLRTNGSSANHSPITTTTSTNYDGNSASTNTVAAACTDPFFTPATSTTVATVKTKDAASSISPTTSLPTPRRLGVGSAGPTPTASARSSLDIYPFGNGTSTSISSHSHLKDMGARSKSFKLPLRPGALAPANSNNLSTGGGAMTAPGYLACNSASSSSANGNTNGNANDEVPIPPRLASLQIGKLLGTGSYANVYLGTLQGVPVAVKALQQAAGPEAEQQLWAAHYEIMVASDLSHPNIVPTIDWCGHFTPEQGGCTWVVQQLCDCGSLSRANAEGWFRMKAGNKPILRFVLETALEIARGMQYLHEHGVIHGDLSSNNVLFVSADNDRMMTAKVIDFGMARAMGLGAGSLQTKSVGTISHVSPELLSNGQLSKSGDVYSFGVLCLEMWTGERAWKGASIAQVIFRISCRGEALQAPDDVPEPLKSLMASCLGAAEKRPTFDDVVMQLEAMLVGNGEE